LNTPPGKLSELVGHFTDSLSGTISGFFGRTVAFQQSVNSPSGHIKVGPKEPAVILTVKGRELFTLGISYRCHWDTKRHFLAVHKSTIKVHLGPGLASEPLFRYEYIRTPDSDTPAAHLHVHAHRSQIAYGMACATELGATRRQLGGQTVSENADLKQLHFPLGGSRFRPCLEDVLEMMRIEFGVDAAPGWKEALHQGRKSWREVQTRAVVRDCTTAAVEALEGLGYEVSIPLGTARAGKDSALTEF
jgi:hypothetical protein